MRPIASTQSLRTRFGAVNDATMHVRYRTCGGAPEPQALLECRACGKRFTNNDKRNKHLANKATCKAREEQIARARLRRAAFLELQAGAKDNEPGPSRKRRRTRGGSESQGSGGDDGGGLGSDVEGGRGGGSEGGGGLGSDFEGNAGGEGGASNPGEVDDDDDDDDDDEEEEDEEDEIEEPDGEVLRKIFPYEGRAGEVLNNGAPRQNRYSQYESAMRPIEDHERDNPYHPFASEMDWDLAKWSKDCDIGSNSFTKLLHIKTASLISILAAKLNLDSKSTRAVNKIIDEDLPPRAEFHRVQYEFPKLHEQPEAYIRNALEVVKDLYGSPEFASEMIYVPEKHYVRKGEGPDAKWTRRYSEMHTARLWEQLQDRLEADHPGATVVPVIVSSDKTQLTTFKDTTAYPVYLTIGNIPKGVRRKPSRQAHILLGYLPSTKMDEETNVRKRRLDVANLYHLCMKDIMESLEEAGRVGVPMTSGDGLTRRCHPILVSFCGDHPEQSLVTLAVEKRCPRGKLALKDRGEEVECEPRDHEQCVQAMRYREDHEEDPLGYLGLCKEANIKYLLAFWRDLPYVDIFQTITPDILHQLYQGVVKHMCKWLEKTYGSDAIDDRVRRVPPSQQIHVFKKGITGLSRITGSQHQDICRVILGAVAEIPHANKTQILGALRGLLDYVYLAQYTEHSDETLAELELALSTIHANKEVFVDLGIVDDFNFAKMHSLRHYAPSVPFMGTADNYNTAYAERLHINFAKEPYKATNMKDEYPQMTEWLLRHEKIHVHERYVAWRLAKRPAAEDLPRARGPREIKFKRTIAKGPNVKALSFEDASTKYHAPRFVELLKAFVVDKNDPERTAGQRAAYLRTYELPFDTVRVYWRMKFWHPDALEVNSPYAQELPDAIHAKPTHRNGQGRKRPGRFDTALINEGGQGTHIGIKGYRVGRIRMIFSLSNTAKSAFRRATDCPAHMAYVEWFSRCPPSSLDARTRLYKIKKSEGPMASAIIDVKQIRRSMHLVPRFGANLVSELRSWTVLDQCTDFYVNSMSDKHAYIVVC